MDQENIWPFGSSNESFFEEPKVSPKKSLLKRIMLLPIRMIKQILLFLAFCFLAALVGKAKKEREFRKRYKKKIIDFGLFKINVWEERR